MPLSRRSFLGRSGAAMIAGTMASSSVWGANERVNMAVIGFNSRGNEHIGKWCGNKEAELVALCDVKGSVLENGAKALNAKLGKKMKTFTDMRDLFADDSIDAVSIATPNHWHTLASIWAMQAGKDVYVEKPCSHNVWEGRQLVNAAKKYGRIVQHGTQIRSSAGVQEGIQKLKEGVIGEVYMARGLCYKRRDTLGPKQPNEAPPADLDWNLWQGPAQEREYNKNIVPYNWHWFWAYGNSDMGNQGVHQMDIARWGLGVELPTKISGMGGKFLYDDDKETPNAITTAFHYPDAGKMGKMLVFETRPFRTPQTNDEAGAGVGTLFYGSEGYMVIPSYSKYQTFLGEKGEPGPSRDDGNDDMHYANFLEAVKTRKSEGLYAPAIEGHYSSALCHLGLLSARLGRSLDFDPAKEQIIGDDEANKMLTREYREPFVVPAIEA